MPCAAEKSNLKLSLVFHFDAGLNAIADVPEGGAVRGVPHVFVVEANDIRTEE